MNCHFDCCFSGEVVGQADASQHESKYAESIFRINHNITVL